MDARNELLRKIQILHFVIYDTALFLDTHPCDQVALEYYHRHREMLEAATDEYTRCYGPLTIDSVLSKNKWAWIDKPWPWELEA